MGKAVQYNALIFSCTYTQNYGKPNFKLILKVMEILERDWYFGKQKMTNEFQP